MLKPVFACLALTLLAAPSFAANYSTDPQNYVSNQVLTIACAIFQQRVVGGSPAVKSKLARIDICGTQEVPKDKVTSTATTVHQPIKALDKNGKVVMEAVADSTFTLSSKPIKVVQEDCTAITLLHASPNPQVQQACRFKGKTLDFTVTFTHMKIR